MFGAYDRLATDALYPTGPVDDRIVVVGIDQQSVTEVGSWPWSRAVQAELIEALAAADPSLVVYDVLTTPPAPGDERLAAAYRRLGEARLVTASLPTRLRATPAGTLAATAVDQPDTQLIGAAQRAHTLVAASPGDGVVRNVPLVVEAPRGSFLPALSLAAWAHLHGLDPTTAVLRSGGVQLGGQLLPTDGNRRLTISWPAELVASAGPRVVSAADVLRGDARDELSGRIVLVGVTDPTLGDRHSTPSSAVGGTPGVLVHAAALNTMTTGAFVHDAPLRTGVLWALALSAAPAFAFQVGRLRLGALAAALVAAVFVIAVVIRFQQGTILAVVWPLIALAAGAAGGFSLRYFGEVRQRQRVTGLFNRYIPEAAARELMYEERLAAVMAGQHLEVSVLFCDLRGFTKLAGDLEPNRVRDLLNVYYDEASKVVAANGGTVIQYVGDEVLAVFGAPVPMDRHEAAALDCAVAIQRARFDITERLATSDLPPIAYGIGVHAGPVIAAHVGETHRQYSLVGSTVNVGSRLCSEAAAGDVVYSEALRAGTGRDPQGEACGRIEPKGVEGGIVVWRLRP